jgi:CheY-like chemotaxis protein
MKTIIIIDDDEEELEAVRQAIYSVDPAAHCLCYTSPTVAISQLSSHSFPHVDCILVDMYNHVVNGLECLRSIKRIPKFKHVDVVMISSSFQETEAVALFSFGAKAVCTKPHSWDGYLAMSKSILTSKTVNGRVMTF